MERPGRRDCRADRPWPFGPESRKISVRQGTVTSRWAKSGPGIRRQDKEHPMADSERPGPDNPIRVFLLDDHEVVRRGVHDLLDDEPDITVVGEAANAEQALTRVPALRPQVAVL